MTCPSTQSFCNEANNTAEAHEICDGLYLGSLKAATNARLLETWRISHILVVDLTSSVLWPNKFCYRRVKLDDTPTSNLLEVLPEALEFLGEAQLRREPALVHCTRGVSRSASVVIAFLMLFKKLGYEDAKALVERQRPVIYPNIGFQTQLQHLASLVAGAPAGHWGRKLTWLHTAVPRGDLTSPSAALHLQEALGPPVMLRLGQLQDMAQTACVDTVLLGRRQQWVSHGLFFELLRQYKAAPSVPGLRDSAEKVIKTLRTLSLQQQQNVNDTPAGIRAALAIAAHIEAWLADLPTGLAVSDGVVITGPSPPTPSAPAADQRRGFKRGLDEKPEAQRGQQIRTFVVID